MYIRRWLNKEGRAYIEAELSDRGDGASVSISDCNKIINLDFYAYNNKELKARLSKIDILIETLQQVRNSLEEQAKK